MWSITINSGDAENAYLYMNKSTYDAEAEHGFVLVSASMRRSSSFLSLREVSKCFAAYLCRNHTLSRFLFLDTIASLYKLPHVHCAQFRFPSLSFDGEFTAAIVSWSSPSCSFSPPNYLLRRTCRPVWNRQPGKCKADQQAMCSVLSTGLAFDQHGK